MWPLSELFQRVVRSVSSANGAGFRNDCTGLINICAEPSALLPVLLDCHCPWLVYVCSEVCTLACTCYRVATLCTLHLPPFASFLPPENPGKQLGAPLPQKTPRKVLGDITSTITNSTQKARKPPVLGTPKPGLLSTRDSASKHKERGRGGGVSSASKVPMQSAHEDFAELEHMAPPELGEWAGLGV